MKTIVKEIIGGILVISLLVSGVSFISSHQVPYKLKVICMDKFPLGDKNGNANYKIIIKYEDGDVETLDVSPNVYITYKVGGHYIFDRSKLVW